MNHVFAKPAVLGLALLLFAGLTTLAVAEPLFPDSMDADLDEPVGTSVAVQNETINNSNDTETDPEIDPELEPVAPPQLFGEVIPGHRIIFVVDASCSMGWGARTRWSRLLAEMLPMLDALGANNAALHAAWVAAGSVGAPDTIKFELIRFNQGANPWKGHMQEATEQNVWHAKNWLTHTQPAGGTNWAWPLEFTYDAVRYDSVDTVYFFSDGEPNTGGDWRAVAAAGRAAAEPGMRFIGQQIGGSALLHTFVELVALSQPNASGTFIPD